MTAFIASKYDEENDPHKPKVGDPIPEEVGGGIIGRVQVATVKELMQLVTETGDEDGDPFDVCKDHPERPLLKYLIWKKP